MVQKKSKYGFNSGNTLRQSPRKNTGGIVSCINFDIERLESRLAMIWGSLEYYERAEWMILNDIMDNHMCLFDEAHFEISLNKKQGWLKWEALEMSLKKLLQLQTVCEVTHLSACVQKQHSGVNTTHISSSASYASQGTSDTQAICDLQHVAKQCRHNTRGIQRKVGPQVSGRSRSSAQAQIIEYSARYRIQHGIADVMYEIKDDDYSILPHTKHSQQDVADIPEKVYKKMKGVKEKQKYWLLGVSDQEIKRATTNLSDFGISRKCRRNEAAVDTKLSCVSRNSREWKARCQGDHLKVKKMKQVDLHKQMEIKRKMRKAKREGTREEEPDEDSVDDVNSLGNKSTFAEIFCKNLPDCPVKKESGFTVSAMGGTGGLMRAAVKDTATKQPAPRSSQQIAVANAQRKPRKKGKVKLSKKGSSYDGGKDDFQMEAYLREAWGGDCDHLEEEAGTRLTLHEMTSALLHGTSSERRALFADCSPNSGPPDQVPNRRPATSSFRIFPTELTYADQRAEEKTNPKITNTLGETHTEPRLQHKKRRKKRANQNLSRPLFLKLKATSVEKACLEKRFQYVFYDEQSSSPRLFAIDLTNELTNSNVRSTAVQQKAGSPTRNGCQDMSLVARNSTALLVFELLSDEQCFKVGNGCATGAIHNGCATAAVHNGCATDAVHNGCATGAVHNGSATGAVHNGSATGAVHNGCATAAVHNGCATAAVQNFHLARMHIKAFLNNRGQTLLCQRLSENLQSHLLYPVTKVVEIFIEVFKNLTADKYQHRLGAAGNQGRLPHALHHSLFDWLHDVGGWQYTKCSQDEAVIATSGSQSGTDLHHLTHVANGKRQPTSPQQPTTCVSCGGREGTFSPERLQSDPTSAMSVTMSRSIKIACCGHRLCLACLTRTLQEYYAAHTLSCLCPAAGCGCSMYSLVLLLGMPLAMYRCHAQRSFNQKINSHPLWHRCPSPHCDRAVKITGTSVLEAEIPVECSCGAIWCFHCQAAAHWPASCSEARGFLTSSQTVHDLSLCDSPFLKYTCTVCGSRKAPYPEKAPAPPMEGCQCVFRLCQKHVHELGGAPTVTSSKEKVLSMETYRDSLLTLMFHHSALYHHDQKATWHWPEVEVKVMKLARCVARSRAGLSDRVRDSSIVMRGYKGHGTIPSPPPAAAPPAVRGHGGHGLIPSPPLAPRPPVIRRDMNHRSIPSPPLAPRPPVMRGDGGHGSIPSPPLAPCPPVIRRTPSTHRLRPCVVTEQLLLSLLQQFLYQGHFLLEPVFVLLMNRGVRHEPLRELATAALALQAVILQIKQVYSELEIVPSTRQLVVLRRLQEDGRKILLLTAQQARSLSNTPCSSASAPATQRLLPGLKSRIL